MIGATTANRLREKRVKKHLEKQIRTNKFYGINKDSLNKRDKTYVVPIKENSVPIKENLEQKL